MGLLRDLLGRATGSYVFRVLPRGVDLAHDVARSLPQQRVELIFDVGANLGQSAERYLRGFPGARIYCFEPVADTFRQLQARFSGHKAVQCERLAFGASEGTQLMALHERSDMAAVVTDAAGAAGARTESVPMATVDGFCRAHGIERINYLKIDTEGADLEVLKGATRMLAEQRIDLVEVEAGMNPGNRQHVPFGTLKDYLETRGYLLFGLYEQKREWITQQPQLRRGNPVFISQRVIEANTGARR